MLTPEEFAAQWGSDPNERLQTFPANAVQALAINDDDKQFLMQCGLPSSAAPYLEFQTAEDECPTVTDAYEALPKFARYRILGGNAEGNPIAVDEQQRGEIVILEQEENFRRTFMNSSVRQLAESLLAYRNMVRAAVEANGENAFFFNQIPATALDTLKQELTRIDASAVAPRTFWTQELENLAEPIADL